MTITIMAIVAGVLLLLHWKGPNAVWGSATLGVIVGVVLSLVKGHWDLLALSFAIGTFAGTVTEWSWRLAKKFSRR